ncbi:MAG: hypothetical protein ACPIOQ_82435, partial [Promethearchaeia archaeon]
MSQLMPFAGSSEHDELHLSSKQLGRLAAEALVLCMPVDLQTLSSRDEGVLRDVLLHVHQLLGCEEDASPEAIARTLRLEGYDDPTHLQELQPHLHFRLLLLVQKRPSDFGNAEIFCAWAERQLALMVSGLIGVLRTAAVASPAKSEPSPSATMAELLGGVDEGDGDAAGASSSAA